jgi:phage shock protein A
MTDFYREDKPLLTGTLSLEEVELKEKHSDAPADKKLGDFGVESLEWEIFPKKEGQESRAFFVRVKVTSQIKLSTAFWQDLTWTIENAGLKMANPVAAPDKVNSVLQIKYFFENDSVQETKLRYAKKGSALKPFENYSTDGEVKADWTGSELYLKLKAGKYPEPWIKTDKDDVNQKYFEVFFFKNIANNKQLCAIVKVPAHGLPDIIRKKTPDNTADAIDSSMPVNVEKALNNNGVAVIGANADSSLISPAPKPEDTPDSMGDANNKGESFEKEQAESALSEEDRNLLKSMTTLKTDLEKLKENLGSRIKQEDEAQAKRRTDFDEVLKNIDTTIDNKVDAKIAERLKQEGIHNQGQTDPKSSAAGAQERDVVGDKIQEIQGKIDGIEAKLKSQGAISSNANSKVQTLFNLLDIDTTEGPTKSNMLDKLNKRLDAVEKKPDRTIDEDNLATQTVEKLLGKPLPTGKNLQGLIEEILKNLLPENLNQTIVELKKELQTIKDAQQVFVSSDGVTSMFEEQWKAKGNILDEKLNSQVRRLEEIVAAPAPFPAPDWDAISNKLIRYCLGMGEEDAIEGLEEWFNVLVRKNLAALKPTGFKGMDEKDRNAFLGFFEPITRKYEKILACYGKAQTAGNQPENRGPAGISASLINRTFLDDAKRAFVAASPENPAPLKELSNPLEKGWQSVIESLVEYRKKRKGKKQGQKKNADRQRS